MIEIMFRVFILGDVWMADLTNILEITQLLNVILFISMAIGLIGVAFWGVQYLTPKARGAILSPFKGRRMSGRRRRRRW